MEKIYILKRNELEGINQFLLEKVGQFSTRFLPAIEGKDFDPEAFAEVSKFCRTGLNETYLQPVLDGVVLGLVKFCNPDISIDKIEQLESRLKSMRNNFVLKVKNVSLSE